MNAEVPRFGSSSPSILQQCSCRESSGCTTRRSARRCFAGRADSGTNLLSERVAAQVNRVDSVRGVTLSPGLNNEVFWLLQELHGDWQARTERRLLQSSEPLETSFNTQ